MMQAKTFVVTGTVGTRGGRKETTLPVDLEKALNAALENLPGKYVGQSISQLNAALPDSVLVTVVYEADDKPKKPK